MNISQIREYASSESTLTLTPIQEYLKNNEITNGAEDMTKRCREAQASVAFLWFAWAGYMASFIVSFFMWRSSAGPSRSRTGSRRGGRPNMTQV